MSGNRLIINDATESLPQATTSTYEFTLISDVVLANGDSVNLLNTLDQATLQNETVINNVVVTNAAPDNYITFDYRNHSEKINIYLRALVVPSGGSTRTFEVTVGDLDDPSKDLTFSKTLDGSAVANTIIIPLTFFLYGDPQSPPYTNRKTIVVSNNSGIGGTITIPSGSTIIVDYERVQTSNSI